VEAMFTIKSKIFLLSASMLFTAPPLSLAAEFIIQKKVIAGICGNLSDLRIFECQVNVGQSIFLNSVSVRCPEGITFPLSPKDRLTYLLQVDATKPGERTKNLLRDLFSSLPEKRKSIYESLKARCVPSSTYSSNQPGYEAPDQSGATSAQ
jgi:hypothetical protein